MIDRDEAGAEWGDRGSSGPVLQAREIASIVHSDPHASNCSFNAAAFETFVASLRGGVSEQLQLREWRQRKAHSHAELATAPSPRTAHRHHPHCSTTRRPIAMLAQ